MNAAIFHPESGRLLYTIPNDIIFAFFLLGTASLTGTTITWLRTQNRAGLAFSLTLAGAIVSWILGFGAEEIILVCLPIIISCSILCSCMFGWKKTVFVERDEKERLLGEV